MNCFMKLNPIPFKTIKSGQKTIELCQPKQITDETVALLTRSDI